jgi:hypothetical protein
MDFANRGNRPAQQTRPGDSQQTQPVGGSSFEPKKEKSSKGGKMDLGKIGAISMLVIVCLLVISVIIGLVFVQNDSNPESDLIDQNRYQAVFLNSPL